MPLTTNWPSATIHTSLVSLNSRPHLCPYPYPRRLRCPMATGNGPSSSTSTRGEGADVQDQTTTIHCIIVSVCLSRTRSNPRRKGYSTRQIRGKSQTKPTPCGESTAPHTLYNRRGGGGYSVQQWVRNVALTVLAEMWPCNTTYRALGC